LEPRLEAGIADRLGERIRLTCFAAATFAVSTCAAAAVLQTAISAAATERKQPCTKITSRPM